MACDLCDAVLDLFRGVRTEDIVVANFQSQDVLDCTKHSTLLQQFREICQKSSSKGPHPRDDFGFQRGQTIGEVTLVESVKDLGRCQDLLLCSQESEAEDFAKGDVLNPDWVDLEKVKSWKAECLNKHGSKCENPLRIWSTTPAWLVDVELECVVPGNTQSEFVALSYTYGDNLGLKVDVDFNVRLQQQHALQEPDIASLLPPTIRHAIYMTKALGERYLWVDALCIIHGNRKETADQLSMMGSIYATAVFTIIAADGDANHGILGLEGISEPRAFKQEFISLADRKVVAKQSGVFALANGTTPYFKRAWTFQEHKLAKRKLFCLKGQAHWECQSKQYHEETIQGAEVDTYIEPRLVESLAGFPELGSITQIISRYNELELRHAEDCHPGITGLCAVLSRSFEGGFLYGLPEMFFDRALAWTPYWPHTEIERRIASQRSKDLQLASAHLPSWSWVGWHGLVNIGDETSRINDRQNTLQETTPIVTWYTAMTPSSSPSERRPIKPYWFENREAWKKDDVEIPGWTAVKHESKEGTFRGQPRLSPSKCEGRVWRHKDVPNVEDHGPSNDWYYPFPVRKITSTTPPAMPEQTPHLFTKTQRAYVLGRRTCDEYKNERLDTGKLIVLCDRNSGRNVGTLHLHTKDDLMLFPLAHNARPLNRQHFRPSPEDDGMETNTALIGETQDDDSSLVEIVAISRTTRHFSTWNEEKQQYEEPLQSKELLNVLWVEWTDGIAYRRAAGSIYQEHWEGMDREEIDLILG